VRTPEADRLREALTGLGMTVTVTDGALRVVGGKIEQIGEAAAAHGIVLHELAPQQGSLEQAFMQTTGQDVQFHARPTAREMGLS
jgi:ABC-2 type transport system ATP-binding protein